MRECKINTTNAHFLFRNSSRKAYWCLYFACKICKYCDDKGRENLGLWTTMHLVSNIANAIAAGALQWRHNEHDSVTNHQPYESLINRLFGRRSKKTSKLRVTGLCAGNSPGTGEFPAQRASNAENVSIWWRHYVSWWRMKQWHRRIVILTWFTPTTLEDLTVKSHSGNIAYNACDNLCWQEALRKKSRGVYRLSLECFVL